MASKKPNTKTKPSKPTKTAPAPTTDTKRLASLAAEVDSLRVEVEELTDDNDNLRERVDVLDPLTCTLHRVGSHDGGLTS